jgi:CheY-like chemotaxis protein
MKTILVIEDNPEIRENTVELLQLHNYEVMSAENGGIGFKMAKENLPDLILCDMMMPETDGRQFLNLAKAHKGMQHIPIVFFSAGTPAIEIQKGLIKESNGFIKKPFSEHELLETIKREINKPDGINLKGGIQAF